MSSLRKGNECLTEKVKNLDKHYEDFEKKINKQQRISRRGNFCCMGVKQERDEECLKSVADILTDMGLPNN